MSEPKPKRRLCTYKGTRYVLLYLGPTKNGFKAKLEKRDRTGDFWVPAGEVEELT